MTEAANVSNAVPQPAHIPDSVVYDFDMFHDPAYLADPHRRVLELSEKAPPIFWTPRNGGHWILQGHAANFEAARDTENFSSEVLPHEQMEKLLEQLSRETGRIPKAYPINLDPPLHAKYRMPLQRVFSPKTVNELSDKIRALAAKFIDEIAGLGQCEFMHAVAEPLPVQVFLEMLGMPVAKLTEYRALVRAHLEAQASPSAAGAIERLQSIAVRRLLKSWATPPASRPTASSFCAWRSCASSSRRSVTSIAVPTMRRGAPDSSRKICASPTTSRTAPSGRTTR